MCYDVQQMLMFCSYMFLSVIKIFDDIRNHFLSYSWIFVLCFVVGFFLLFLCEGKNFWGNYQTFYGNGVEILFKKLEVFVYDKFDI